MRCLACDAIIPEYSSNLIEEGLCYTCFIESNRAKRDYKDGLTVNPEPTSSQELMRHYRWEDKYVKDIWPENDE